MFRVKEPIKTLLFFRKGRSTVDQVNLLTEDIQDCFEANEKAGAVLLDLTAAYDTMWHQGLTLQFLRCTVIQ